MGNTRKIRKILKSKPTTEGAGVHLRRVFGYSEVPAFDPFLLLDDFHSDNPDHYLKGFPWHPHRGIETITYVLQGDVEHGDSMGNKGVIGSGDVQWMTAGSGIIHQEMPKGDANGVMWGFQLWGNLPATHKMMNPRYRDIKSGRIQEVTLADGIKIKIICGTVNGQQGPVRDIVVNPEYLDILVPPHTEFTHPTDPENNVFAYIVDGKGYCCKEKDPFSYEVSGANWFDTRRDPFVERETLVLFDAGEQVIVLTEEEPVRFLLISGRPIKEPVAWYGPIVMNTREELRIAFEEYDNGTFIKYRAGPGIM
jgi:redox-sensitive bicupin YhaK (pirin superfamily)